MAEDEQYLSLLLKPAEVPILPLSELLRGNYRGIGDLGRLSFVFDPALSGVVINMNGQRIFAGDKTAASGNYDYIISEGKFIFSNGGEYSAANAEIKTVFSRTTVRRFN